MAFVARKPFLHNGVRYAPGDVVKDFPDAFFRSEGLIRTGFIVERPDAPAAVERAVKAPTVTKARKKSQPVVQDFSVAQAANVELVDQ